MKKSVPRRIGSSIRYFSSINEEEVGKFAKIGSAWWNEKSLAGTGPLHAMNPVRVKFIREQLAERFGKTDLPPFQQLSGLRILDAGCGGGLLSESLARLGADMTSIDPSPENIQVAKAHAARDPLTSKINYRVATVEEICKEEEKFDAVCSLEVIEHVNDPYDFVRNCLKCLKPNGSLIMSTMNRNNKSYLMAIAAAENVLGIVPPGTHDWYKFITPDELRGMMETDTESPAKVVSTKGLVLAPPNPLKCLSHGLFQWKLSDTDIDVNYIVHAVRI